MLLKRLKTFEYPGYLEIRPLKDYFLTKPRMKQQSTYVPEIPELINNNKENPLASRPKFKQISSAKSAAQFPPSRLALGNLSGNENVEDRRLNGNTMMTVMEGGAEMEKGLSARPPLHSLGYQGNVNQKQPPLPSPPPPPSSSISLPNQPRPPPRKSSLSSENKATDELSRIIQETNARNAARTEAERKGSLSSSNLGFRRKSLVGGDISLIGGREQDNLRNLVHSLASNPARLKGAAVPLPSSRNFMLPSSDTMIARREEPQLVKNPFDISLEQARRNAMKKEQVQRERRRILQAQKEEELEAEAKEVRERMETFEDPTNNKRDEDVVFEETVTMNPNDEAEKERIEEESRALRRKQQKQEEFARKGDDLVTRARALESAGQTAAALALFKEAVYYLPANEKLQSHVEKLRTQLRGVIDSTVNKNAAEESDDDDPLEALFKGQSTTITSSQEVENITTRSEHQDKKKPLSIAAEPFLTRANRLVSMLPDKPKQRVFSSLVNMVHSLLEIEKVQRDSLPYERKGVKVQFHLMDCAIDPPPQSPSRNDDEFESSLYPVDKVIDSLSAAIKAADEARKIAPPKQFDWIAGMKEFSSLLLDGEIPGKYAGFLSCTVYFALGLGTCACFHEGKHRHCLKSAISPRDRLSRMLSMGLRACLRRAFNGKDLMLVPGTGSYRYAYDDVAAVAHQALLLFETRLQVVDSIVLIGKTKSSRGTEDEQIARIGEFVEAHKFLMNIFPNEQACLEMSDADSVCWAKIRKYLTIAREHKCEDELVLAPLASLPDLVRKLRDQSNLVAAARGHVEMAFRRAMKEDSCGQCTCEGARRRRASAMGTWIAPTLGSSKNAKFLCCVRTCGKCSSNMAEKDEQISCECCQKLFHLKCVGLTNGYDSDFVCSKCVPKFKSSSMSSTRTVEEEEE